MAKVIDGKAVAAVNHFGTDTEAEVQTVGDFVATQGSEAILCRQWAPVLRPEWRQNNKLEHFNVTGKNGNAPEQRSQVMTGGVFAFAHA